MRPPIYLIRIPGCLSPPGPCIVHSGPLLVGSAAHDAQLLCMKGGLGCFSSQSACLPLTTPNLILWSAGEDVQQIWQPSSPQSGTASHGPRQNSHSAAQASGPRQKSAASDTWQTSEQERKKHRRRSRDRGNEHGMPIGTVDRQFEGKKGRKQHHSRYKPGRQH